MPSIQSVALIRLSENCDATSKSLNLLSWVEYQLQRCIYLRLSPWETQESTRSQGACFRCQLIGIGQLIGVFVRVVMGEDWEENKAYQRG